MERIKVDDIIGDEYKVLSIKGGAGKIGMGITYVCLNLQEKYIYALKTFQNRFLSSLELINSFKREALAWIKLDKHPYIVNALAVHHYPNPPQPFISMEYISPDNLGRNTLTHYLYFPISLKTALKWGIQFCFSAFRVF